MMTFNMIRDREEGYPGDVLYNVRYSLDDQGGVRIDFTGVEDDDLNDGAHGDNYNQVQWQLQHLWTWPTMFTSTWLDTRSIVMVMSSSSYRHCHRPNPHQFDQNHNYQTGAAGLEDHVMRMAADRWIYSYVFSFFFLHLLPCLSFSLSTLLLLDHRLSHASYWPPSFSFSLHISSPLSLSASPLSRTSWSQQDRLPQWPALSLIWGLQPGDHHLGDGTGYFSVDEDDNNGD